MMGRWTRLLIVCVVLLTAVVLAADAEYRERPLLEF